MNVIDHPFTIRSEIRHHWMSLAFSTLWGILFVFNLFINGMKDFLVFMSCNKDGSICNINGNALSTLISFTVFAMCTAVFFTMVITEQQLRKKYATKNSNKEDWRIYYK